MLASNKEEIDYELLCYLEDFERHLGSGLRLRVSCSDAGDQCSRQNHPDTILHNPERK
jgi:hypothetical protein